MLKYFFLFLIVLQTGVISAQKDVDEDSTMVPIDIGNNADYSGFSVLDSMLNTHRLFLTGENFNYTPFNAKVEFKTLRYMNYKVGMRNYLMESSAAKAALVNQYISEGDSTVEKLLQSVSTVKYMRLYKNLKKLNSKLADSVKIRVFGIDVERSNALPLVQMSQCFSEDSVPDDLRIPAEAIRGTAKYIISRGLEEYERQRDGNMTESDNYFYNPSAFSVRMSVEEFMKMYDSLKPRFESWLGRRFGEFDQAVGWLKEYKTYTKYRQTAFEYTWREEELFRRLNALLQQYPNEKFFGQFSMCHAAGNRVPRGCGPYDFSTLVYKLKHSEESNEKNVVNMGIYYSRELGKSEGIASKLHKQYEEELETLFKRTKTNTAVIVDLKKLKEDLKLKDEFQFILLNDGVGVYDDDEWEYDTTTAGSKYSPYFNSENAKAARIRIGGARMHNNIDLDRVDKQLNDAGMERLGYIEYLGAEFSVSAADKSFFRAYYGSGYSSASNFNSSVLVISGSESLIFRKNLKWGVSTDLAYYRHSITQNPGLDSGLYVYAYSAPKVYINPALVFGISTQAYLDLMPFYIVAMVGQQWDLSRSSWKLDGVYTGSAGGLSNNALTWSLGFGFCAPIFWRNY
ncbi:MAG: hypothetical protein KG003_04130 [Bacteroidetes bacterium]|nr:hypothetical protein [Bacteroidota bacterium]